MDSILEESIIECSKHLEKTTNVGLSENNKDLYYLIDNLVNSVRKLYPNIACKNKCSNCCIDSGLPRTTAIEWQIIFKFIKKELDTNTKNEIIKNTKKLYSNQIEELLQEKNRVKEPHTKITNKDPKPNLLCLKCPFLIDNSCSIYKARPAICRSYGFFTIRVAQKTTIFTCQMSADQMRNMLIEKGVKHWALPVWDKFADQLEFLNSDKEVSLLPLWILTHIKEGQFVERLDLSPNFNIK